MEPNQNFLPTIRHAGQILDQEGLWQGGMPTKRQQTSLFFGQTKNTDEYPDIFDPPSPTGHNFLCPSKMSTLERKLQDGCCVV